MLNFEPREDYKTRLELELYMGKQVDTFSSHELDSSLESEVSDEFGNFSSELRRNTKFQG